MMQGQASDASRRMTSSDSALYAQPAAYSRSFRPLQAQPQFDPSRTQIRPSQPYQMYAPPSIQPSQATAMGSFMPSARQYGQQPQSPYMMSSSDAPRGPYQGGYSYPSPQEQMGMAPPQLYSNPIFPRSQMPQQFDPGMGMMGHPSLQLPPIRPAPKRSPIDPALVQGGTASQEQSPQDQDSGAGMGRQPDPKRPRMDIQGILGPKHE